MIRRIKRTINANLAPPNDNIKPVSTVWLWGEGGGYD